MADLARDVLVIAYGNPQRGDDGVAWAVLDSLRATQPRPHAPPLCLKHVHQLTPELAEPASRARAVIFVDARADPDAGTVSCEPVTPAAGSPSLTHSLSPQAVLLYAERLFGRAPRAAVVTVGGTAFGHGEDLSPEVLQAVPKAVSTPARANMTLGSRRKASGSTPKALLPESWSRPRTPDVAWCATTTPTPTRPGVSTRPPPPPPASVASIA